MHYHKNILLKISLFVTCFFGMSLRVLGGGDPTCPSAAFPTRLSPGGQGRVLSSVTMYDSAFHSNPAITELLPGTRFAVLTGTMWQECADEALWVYVQTGDDLYGWIPEVYNDQYLLEPMANIAPLPTSELSHLDTASFEAGPIDYNGVHFYVDANFATQVNAEFVAVSDARGYLPAHLKFSLTPTIDSKLPLMTVRVMSAQDVNNFYPGTIPALRDVLDGAPETKIPSDLIGIFSDAGMVTPHEGIIPLGNGKAHWALMYGWQDAVYPSNFLVNTVLGLTDDGQYYIQASFVTYYKDLSIYIPRTNDRDDPNLSTLLEAFHQDINDTIAAGSDSDFMPHPSQIHGLLASFIIDPGTLQNVIDEANIAVGNIAADLPEAVPTAPTVSGISLSTSIGQQIAFYSDRGSTPAFYVMGQGTDIHRIIINATSIYEPAWSPDGTQIAFSSDEEYGNRQIFVMNADGTAVSRVTENADSDSHPVWSPDGTHIAYLSFHNNNLGLYVMDADGTNQYLLASYAEYEGPPSWSPDGAWIAFVTTAESNREIYLVAADRSKVQRLTYNAGTDQTPVWSPDGSLIAFISDRDDQYGLYVMNADGSDVRRLANTDSGSKPAWSPDGTYIASVSEQEGNTDIYLMAVDGTAVRRLTNNPAYDAYPIWLPLSANSEIAQSLPTEEPLQISSSESTRDIAFVSDRAGNRDIYVMAADGTNITPLTNEPEDDYAPTWSPDGAHIAFVSERDGIPGIYVMTVDGMDIQRLSSNESYDLDPAWSPDGTQIAFVSEDNGNRDIYVMGADGSNVRRITDHVSEDYAPAWSLDGTHIAFLSQRNNRPEIYTVAVDGGDVLSFTDFGPNNGDISIGDPAYTPDGKYIASWIGFEGKTSIYRMAVDGTETSITLDNQMTDLTTLTYSPDQTHIASWSNSSGNGDIYVMTKDGAEIQRITSDLANESDPAWSPVLN